MQNDSDLAGGDVSSSDQEIVHLGLKEETQRLRWKTAVLWFSSALIAIFYLALLYAIFCRTSVNEWKIAALAAIPTLIAAKIIHLVSSRNSSEDKSPIESPWYQLFRELVDTLKNK